MRGRLSAVAGLLLMGVGAYVLVSGVPADVVLPQPADSVRATAIATTPPPATTAPPATVAPPTASPTPAPTVSRVIAEGYRVLIPRLRIDLPIQEGDLGRDIERQQTPEGFAFHLPDTAIPGQGSNTYLYAHARTGMFLALWQARQGDLVIVSTPAGQELRYVVTEVHPRVTFDDLSWVQPSAEERLTLQTSTGPNPRDPRFVVVALPEGAR